MSKVNSNAKVKVTFFWGGAQYRTVVELAKAASVSRTAVYDWIKRGGVQRVVTDGETVPTIPTTLPSYQRYSSVYYQRPRHTPFTYQGRAYDNLQDYVQQHKLPPTRAYYCSVNGNKYHSIAAASRAENMTLADVVAYINANIDETLHAINTLLPRGQGSPKHRYRRNKQSS
jgi:hypothetical protein